MYLILVLIGLYAGMLFNHKICPVERQLNPIDQATDCKITYLHICEGATQLRDGRKDDTTGKLISYLVSDFIKAME